MKITWYGHAAFLVEGDGTRIILDPYRSPDCGGYEPIHDHADVVAVSHENDRYHSHLGQIVPPFEVVRGLELPPEGREVHGVRFHAVPCFESPDKLPGDEVTILHFRLEGKHVVHLGDLGHLLEEDQYTPLANADVLLVPAGGPPTIDFPLIPELIAKLQPRLILPMHFKTPKINLDIQPVERFLEMLPDWTIDRPGPSTIQVEDPDRIIVLDYAR